MKHHFLGGAWKPGTSKIPMKTRYKPGGNLLVMTKKIKSRTTELKPDGMGRCVWTVLQGREDPISIVKIYVPRSKKGIFSAYTQQYQQIQKDSCNKSPQVMETFYPDLHRLLQKLKPAKIILMRDFNHDLTARR